MKSHDPSRPERTWHRKSVHIRANIDIKRRLWRAMIPIALVFHTSFLQFLSLEIKYLFIAAKEECDASDE